MTTITIPKELSRKGELVIIPREDYEELLHFRLKNIKEVKMTPLQKRMLERARRNLRRGKFLTIHELKRKLGIKDR